MNSWKNDCKVDGIASSGCGSSSRFRVRLGCIWAGRGSVLFSGANVKYKCVHSLYRQYIPSPIHFLRLAGGTGHGRCFRQVMPGGEIIAGLASTSSGLP